MERDYFKAALDYYKEIDIQYNAYYTSRLTMWNHVRALIYSYYGVKTLKQMKPEWKEDANNKAIDILKLVKKGKSDE